MATTSPFKLGQAAKLMANKFGPAASVQPKPVTVPSQPANKQPTTTSVMGQAAKNFQAQATPQATYKSPQAGTLNKMDQFIANNSNYQFKQPDAFKYDQNSDPAYLSQLAEAKRNAQDQQVDTNAMLRASGQGKSSYSETVASQIGNKAMASLADTLVPQLMQQAYQRYNDDSNRNLQVQQMNYGTQQDAVSNLAGLYGLQDKEYFQNPVTEAGLTGNYLPEEAKQAIAGINSLKKQAEAKGITADGRSGLSMQADELRSTLQRLGIDPSFYGADKSLKQSSQNNPGVRTLGGQAQDTANKNANLNAAATYMDATGKVVTPQNDWSGYMRQAANSSTPTLAGQGQAFNQNLQTKQDNRADTQQKWQNNFATEQQAYTAVRAAISDSQWKAQFDQGVAEFGFNSAMDRLRISDNKSYQEAQIALSQDDSSRQWAALDYDMSKPKGTADSGLSANQILDSMKSLYTEPVYATDKYNVKTKIGEQFTTDAAKREQMFLNIVDAGKSDAETKQILSALGLTKKEIETFTKKNTSGN